MLRALAGLLTLSIVATAAAQQEPIFDPDDFVDPQQHEAPVFISRLVLGVTRSPSDDYRPLHQDLGFVHVANAVYWSDFQFDYKHTELRGENESTPPHVTRCACDPPLYFPTAHLPDEIPAAPLPGSKETVQFAWYRPFGKLLSRYRVSFSHQSIDTVVNSASGQEISHLSGRERSFGFEGDTHVRFAGRDFWGSLSYARTSRTGTTEDRTQDEFVYTSRFPATAFRKVLFRTMLAVGGVSNRGGTAINVVNPYFELFWHDYLTKANFHLIYSPQMLNDGTHGWRTTHQIALFADRALFVKLVR